MTPLDAQLAAIELAWTLREGTALTSSQRETLEAFAGWGGLAQAFAAHPTGQWLKAADRIEDALPAEALTAAREQVDTSFFTPKSVTDAVFTLLASTGFRGGSILEPGCGSGAFMGSAPAEWDVAWTGIDVDPTSARIARLLNPGSTILTGALEKTPLRDDFFDVAIGNVPFSPVRISDKEGRYAALHNYFIHRAVDAVRPGGYVLLVTSRHTVDSESGIFDAINDMKDAAFIGAVRLPSGAFAEAGTEAVTDIVVVRKNDPSCILPAYSGPADFESVEEYNGYYGYRTVKTDLRTKVLEPETAGQEIVEPAVVSRYWEVNPEHVAGVMLSRTFARSPLLVRSNNPDADVRRAVNELAEVLPPLAPRVVSDAIADVILADADGRKEGSFHYIDGALYRVTVGVLAPVRGNRELEALVVLRDLAVELLVAESDQHASDASLAGLRADTLRTYESYVKQFGRLNRGSLVEGKLDEETGLPALSWRRPAMGGFRRDPDAALVMALEVFDQDTGEAGPAPILLRRVNGAPAPVERVDTAEEALAVTLGECGRVDLGRVAGLLGLTSDEDALAALGDLVYLDHGRCVPASEYLSGNVRRKLAQAKRLVEQGFPEVQRNVDALEKVVPADLGPLDIRMNLGSPFLTSPDIEAFLREEMGVRWPSVAHVAGRGTWEVDEAHSDAAALMQYGTPNAAPTYLLECALNARMPEISDKVWNAERGTYVQVRNVPASAAANEKLELIRERFATWVWEGEERAQRICAEYNEKLNSHVARVYSGAGLTFPGLSSGVTPWAHQRAAVERITSSPRALLAHPVGAGKTLEMCLAARTLRQFGLANKPLIVVPNHLLEQIAREAQQAFPTGRFLIASKDDLARDARRLFAARCATGDWDAVIMTHSAFTSIPVHPENEERWLQEQKHELRVTLQTADGGRKEKGPKAIARAIRALDARVAKLRSGVADENAIWFEQLGVDYIMVDECHLFRRLDTGSASRDSGFGSGYSKRATDLLIKVETLAERRPQGAPICAFFTGTPWSNTLAETWVWQRFLQPDTLRDLDLLAFDAWVSAFIRYETNIEVSPDGSGFRLQRRPAGVVNAPELKTMLAQVADIIDPETLGLHRPMSSVRTVVVDPSPEQHTFVKSLAERADLIRNKTAEKRARIDGGETDDSMLLVCNDGRKVALDPRLVGIDETSTKIERLAELVAETYHANANRSFGTHPTPGAFQLAFLDLGTPKPGESSTYGRLRRGVVDRGVPAHMVRFVHEATTDKARAALFASCRDGEVALLVGSTSKVGMGTNVQTRLTHLWHVDAPWLPSDVIQRDGRGVRPGNLSEHVAITRIVTEGTFDAYTWQALERKSRSFDALYSTGATAREIEDVSAATISYGEVKALASGNPLLLHQANIRAEVKKLQLMRSVHLQSIRKAEQSAKTLDERAEGLVRRAERAEDAVRVMTAEASESEREALSRAVERWLTPDTRANSGWLPRSNAPWRKMALNPTYADRYNTKVPPTGVDVQLDYATILHIPLAPKLVRRGAQAVAGYLSDRVDVLLDALGDEAKAWRREAQLLSAQADESRYAAATTTFTDEARLQDAIVRLAQVDALIAADANEHAGVLAA